MGGCRRLTDPEVEEVLKLLNSTRDAVRNAALFLLGVRTGFRISELLSLRLGDVYEAGKLSGYVSVAKRHMKKKVEGRTVALHPQAVEALGLWVALLASSGADAKTPLFRSRQGGKAISRIMAWTILRNAYKACGLDGKLGTHSMRKTFAARIHEKSGRDIFKTQKALGHASPSSTAAYLSVTQEEIDDLVLKS